jgi:hypothetical protein
MTDNSKLFAQSHILIAILSPIMHLQTHETIAMTIVHCSQVTGPSLTCGFLEHVEVGVKLGVDRGLYVDVIVGASEGVYDGL